MSSIVVRSTSSILLFAASFFTIAVLPASAQDTDHEWQKEYTVSSKPSLSLETGDSNVEIHSCGDCKSIRIHVQSGRMLSEYRLEEHQDQDHVYFTFKERLRVGIQIHWTAHNAPKVTVDVPSHLDLDAQTADGSLVATQLNGVFQIRSSDGAVSLDDLHGNLNLTSSDGNITIHNGTGTIEGRTSDGSMKVDGQFSSVQLHTSDGTLELALAPGSQLTAPSRIESSDGKVLLRLPQALSADLDVTTRDGHLDCKLPLSMDNYSSSDSGGHHVHGHLNAGGTLLSIHTPDGNVSIAAL